MRTINVANTQGNPIGRQARTLLSLSFSTFSTFTLGNALCARRKRRVRGGGHSLRRIHPASMISFHVPSCKHGRCTSLHPHKETLLFLFFYASSPSASDSNSNVLQTSCTRPMLLGRLPLKRTRRSISSMSPAMSERNIAPPSIPAILRTNLAPLIRVSRASVSMCICAGRDGWGQPLNFVHDSRRIYANHRIQEGSIVCHREDAG